MDFRKKQLFLLLIIHQTLKRYGISQRIQGVRPQRQRNGHGRRRDHRRRVRQNRIVARERHPDAAHRRADRKHRLLAAAARHLESPRRDVERHALRGRHGDRRRRSRAGCRSGRTDLLELRRIHPAVRGFHDPGALRVPDGQADEPADEEKGRGSGSRSRTARTDERGAAAHRNPRPAERAEEISGKIPEPNSPAF